MHAVAYRLIAQALGRALAYIMHEQGISQEPMADRKSVV